MTIRPVRVALVLGLGLLVGSPAPAQQPAKDSGKKLLGKLFTDAVAAANEATVRIKADGKQRALGTIVSADGYILSKGSELRGKLTCVLRDDTTVDAQYIGYHKPTDLALLKIDQSGLTPVKFWESKYATVGNWIAVTGLTKEPLGVGVVSVAARKLYGEQADIQNLNKGALGIRMNDPTDGDGVLIERVEPDTAAAKAGLKARDILYEFDGIAIKTREGLIDTLEAYKPGDAAIVRVRRGEEELAIRVKLGQRADFDQGAFQNGMGGSLSGRRTGFPMVIQHDTVISPDACGGPIVDLDGRVLGINIARAGRVETWALPAEVITPILKDLKAGKYPAPASAVKTKS